MGRMRNFTISLHVHSEVEFPVTSSENFSEIEGFSRFPKTTIFGGFVKIVMMFVEVGPYRQFVRDIPRAL